MGHTYSVSTVTDSYFTMQQLFLIALCVAAASAFVCPEDICSRMNCNAVTACNGRIAKGLCGCCDTCIEYLREGDACQSTPLLGTPMNAECGLDTVCSKITGTCIKPVALFEEGSKCEKHRAVARESGLLGTFVPKCDADGTYSRDQFEYQKSKLIGRMFHCETNGNYKSVQCLGSVCFCADKLGKQIGNSGVHISQRNSLNC